MEKRGKELEESGTSSLVVTKLNCHLCVNLRQYISQSCAQVECFYHPASTREQNQSCSSMFFISSPRPPNKRVIIQAMKTPFSLCKTPENFKDGNLVLGRSSAVEVLLLKAMLC